MNTFEGYSVAVLKYPTEIAETDDLFFTQSDQLAKETPDLKIQDNFIMGVSTPHIVTTQALGAIFGGSLTDRKEVTDYVVQDGDTIASIAQRENISINSLLYANPDLSKNSILKTGQTMLVPPVDGVLYVVKSGDTISEIAKKYKSSVDKIIDFNSLKDEGDIFVEDLIFLPDGQMPQKLNPVIVQVAIPDTFFIYPTEGIITQGPHGYLGRGVDIANKCGTPIYAAASGTVQRAQFNTQYGNFITIDHGKGILTYSGHLQTIMVKPGDLLTAGQIIGLMGKTGRAATGCHTHFEVRGAKNFLAKYGVGYHVSFK